MIGGQKNSPRVIDQQQQFQPGGPLDCVDQVARFVRVGDDATTGFVLDIEVAPLASGQLVQQMLPRAVGGDGHGIAEQHGAGVSGHVRVGVEILGKLYGFGLHGVPVIAAVGMVLQVRHVGAMTFEMLHRLQRRRDVSGCAEIIAVQVDGMGQSEFFDDLCQLGHDDRRA